jgi:actin-like protein 6A
MEVANPIVDGLSRVSRLPVVMMLNPRYFITVGDWTPIHGLIEHALVDTMRCTPSEHPILVTEPAWNTSANRERMAEMMFEEFQVPAFYIANTGVLNTYDICLYFVFLCTN